MGSDNYNKNDSNIYGFDYQNKNKLFISKEERFKKFKEYNTRGLWINKISKEWKRSF